MGQIAITENVGFGEYVGKPIFDLDRAKNLKFTIEREIDKLELEIPKIELAITAKIAEIDIKSGVVQQSIIDVKAENLAPEAEVLKIESIVNPLLAEISKLDNELSILNSRLTNTKYNLVAKKKELAAIDLALDKEDEEITVWAVDYVVDLPLGIYATIEIARESSKIFIAPRTRILESEERQRIDLLANLKITQGGALQAERDAIDLVLTPQLDDYRALRASQLAASDQETFDSLGLQIQALYTVLVDTIAKDKKLKADREILVEQVKVLAKIQSDYNLIVSNGVIVPKLAARIQPSISSGSSAVFYNKALIVGFQKWRPTFRSGVITSIVGDNCTVRLDTSKSSQEQGTTGVKFDITPFGEPEIVNVPIKYGDCDGSVFRQGDAVIVQWRENVNSGTPTGIKFEPTVIGFVSNPRICSRYYLTTGLYNVFEFKQDGSPIGVGSDLYFRDASTAGGFISEGGERHNVSKTTAATKNGLYLTVNNNLVRNSTVIGAVPNLENISTLIDTTNASTIRDSVNHVDFPYKSYLVSVHAMHSSKYVVIFFNRGTPSLGYTRWLVIHDIQLQTFTPAVNVTTLGGNLSLNDGHRSRTTLSTTGLQIYAAYQQDTNNVSLSVYTITPTTLIHENTIVNADLLPVTEYVGLRSGSDFSVVPAAFGFCYVTLATNANLSLPRFGYSRYTLHFMQSDGVKLGEIDLGALTFSTFKSSSVNPNFTNSVEPIGHIDSNTLYTTTDYSSLFTRLIAVSDSKLTFYVANAPVNIGSYRVVTFSINVNVAAKSVTVLDIDPVSTVDIGGDPQLAFVDSSGTGLNSASMLITSQG